MSGPTHISFLHCENEHYSIKHDSTLYLCFSKNNWETGDVCLHKILAWIKNYCLKGRHFDASNPSMIICDQMLENVFQQRALHVNQVRAALAKSLVRLTAAERTRSDPCVIPLMRLVRNVGTNVRFNDGTGDNVDTLVGLKYKLSEALKELFIQTNILQHQQELFTYGEVAELFSKYMERKRTSIVDIRNIHVAMLFNDPLRDVFKCSVFHVSQTRTLLKKHMIPVLVGYKTGHTYQLRQRKI